MLFTEKLENSIEDLETKMTMIARGADPYAAKGGEGKLLGLLLLLVEKLFVSSSGGKSSTV